MRRKSLTANAAEGMLLIGAMLLAVTPGRAVTWGANYFPNVPLTTQDGKTVRFYDDLLKDKRVVINFIYTRCGDSCPLETARLAQVQRILGERMGRDVFFYSFSLDPVNDTPKALKEYSAKFHAGPGWLFLTGKKADIELIRAKLGQAASSGQDELTDHSTSLMIGNVATGQWVRESSMDHPQFIAVIIRDWLSGWTDRAPSNSYADAPALTASMTDKGTYLFQTRCAACHTTGQGDSVGPDLLGVTNLRKADWLVNMIATPNQMLRNKDPIAMALYARYNQIPMPNLRLTDVDVNALMGYLQSQDAAAHGQAKAEGIANR